MRKTVLAALVIAPALAVAGCGGADEPGAAPDDQTSTSAPAPAPDSGTSQAPAEDVHRFTIEGGERTEGPERIEVRVGEPVTIEVTSDVADAVHVHGYDKTLELTPGEPATVKFTADIPGVFEIELHEAGGLITQLRVTS
ncbi:MAG: hypothetical protein ACRDSE_07855 [Pseudonocardiaceae bacterium]